MDCSSKDNVEAPIWPDHHVGNGFLSQYVSFLLGNCGPVTAFLVFRHEVLSFCDKLRDKALEVQGS